jgi:hypothetical protein
MSGEDVTGLCGAMNPYTVLKLASGTADGAALAERLAAWHDAMVAHERRRLTMPSATSCDDECPHAEARLLWAEARRVFGDRADELRFLRSRATASSPPTRRQAIA